MGLDETVVTRAIIDRYYEKLLDCVETDVAIAGGGPSGLVAGYRLARAGKKVALFERNLSIGGGMWGGGMMFNEIVIQEEAKSICDEFGVRTRQYRDGYYTADSVETVSMLTAKAIQAGLSIFNCISVEDVTMRSGPDRVVGLVVNWGPVSKLKMHVDPLALRTKFVIDGTGHPTEVVSVVEKKVPGKLLTPSGVVEGEQSMWVEKGEAMTIENTKEVFPGLYVTGMAANAVFGAPRMGPIFGGMLLSGAKVADLILERLQKEAS